MQEGREREAENMRNRDGDPSGTRPLGVAKPDHSPRPVRPGRGLDRRAIGPGAVRSLGAETVPIR